MADVQALSLAQRAREEARRVAEEAHAETVRRDAERRERFVTMARERVEELTGEAVGAGLVVLDPYAQWSVTLHSGGLSFHLAEHGNLSLVVNCSTCADLMPGVSLSRFCDLAELGGALERAAQTDEAGGFRCEACYFAAEEAKAQAPSLTPRIAAAPWSTVHAGPVECVLVPLAWGRVAEALEAATS